MSAPKPDLPLDLAAVQADDALLNALGSSNPEGSDADPIVEHRLIYRFATRGLEDWLGLPDERQPHWHCSCGEWRLNRDDEGRPERADASMRHQRHVLHARLTQILTAWRRDVESEPMPRLMDTDTALALIRRRSEQRGLRRLARWLRTALRGAR